VPELLPISREIASTLPVEQEDGFEVLLDRLLSRPEKLLAKLHPEVRPSSHVVEIGLTPKDVRGEGIEDDLEVQLGALDA